MSEENIDQSAAEVEAPEVNSEEQITEEQTSDEVQGESEQASDDVEVEYEGEKYRVPPALKDALLRYADYTQKTQEVARTREEIESQRAAFEQERQLATQSYQRQQANLQAYANLSALDSNLSQYESVNWQQWLDQDPISANKAYIQYNQLRDQRGQLANYVAQAEQQSVQEEQANLQQKLTKTQEFIQREIPNWNQELDVKLKNLAIETGFKPEELGIRNLDHRHVKLLYYANIGMEAMKKTNAPKPANVVPMKTVSSTKAGVQTDPEKMSDRDWAEWRNKQKKR